MNLSYSYFQGGSNDIHERQQCEFGCSSTSKTVGVNYLSLTSLNTRNISIYITGLSMYFTSALYAKKSSVTSVAWPHTCCFIFHKKRGPSRVHSVHDVSLQRMAYNDTLELTVPLLRRQHRRGKYLRQSQSLKGEGTII